MLIPRLSFSANRYTSYKTEWKIFKNGGIVISDRYTTSNMTIHQLSKIEDRKREEYLNAGGSGVEQNGATKTDCCVFFGYAL